MSLTRDEFHVLIEEHALALYRLAYRLVGDVHEAEDVVQETLRSAWAARERYDPGRGGRAWLASILRRRAVDRWRRVAHKPSSAGDWLPDVSTTPFDPLSQELSDEMQVALRKLSPDLRESLLLVVVGELTHQEAADVLGVPLGTVLSRVSRGRRRLREHLLAVKS